MKKIFKSFGYRQISTSTFESYELFANTNGTVKKREMLKLIDSNGEVLVLRPDATIPIAKMVASGYGEGNDYQKLYYITKIFRQREYYNNMKEFTQGGVEFFGRKGIEADGEVIALAIKILLSNVEGIRIDLGQADYYKGLIEEIKINERDEKVFRRLIENKNFNEIKAFLEDMKINQDIKDTLMQIPMLYGEPKKVIQSAKKLYINDRVKKALENLDEVYNILCDYGYEKYIFFDLGIINYLDYYTGIVFKGYMANYGREILSGGRYDKLLEEFGKSIPATGFGINIDEIIEGVKWMKKTFGFKYYLDYQILYDDKDRKAVFKFADNLRDKGLSVETNLCRDLKKHLDNLNNQEVRKVIVFSNDKSKVIDILGNNVYNVDTDKLENTIAREELLVESIH